MLIAFPFQIAWQSAAIEKIINMIGFLIPILFPLIGLAKIYIPDIKCQYNLFSNISLSMACRSALAHPAFLAAHDLR
jgi:adenylyl- and sulfurtransferase ThiI